MLIISAYDSRMSELGKISAQSIQDYCAHWNFGYKIFTEGFDTTKHPSWSKIIFIKQELANNETVWWLDSDTFITNLTINIEDYLDNKEVYISKDCRSFNCGSMIFRQSKANFQLLDKIWNTPIQDHIWYEQVGFIHEYYNDMEVRSRTKILPQNIFNAYLYKEIWAKEDKGQWTEDSLVLHLPGISLEEKIKWASNLNF